MPETYARDAGLFEPDEIAVMTAVVDELCREAPERGLLSRLPESEIRSTIGRLVVDLQCDERLPPPELKSKALARLALA